MWVWYGSAVQNATPNPTAPARTRGPACRQCCHARGGVGGRCVAGASCAWGSAMSRLRLTILKLCLAARVD